MQFAFAEAEQFGDLDPKIDYRKPGADEEGLPFTGFHRIEKDLWVPAQDALNSAVWRVELLGRSADFAWGPFVSSAITLLATALVIYLIINVLKLDRLDKKKD